MKPLQAEFDFEAPLEPLARPRPGRREKGTIAQRFARYHAANPDVYAMFLQFARDLRARGYTRASADLIAQRIRWERMLRGPGDAESGFKLNDAFTSRYARKLAAEHPEFATFFEFRELRSP